MAKQISIIFEAKGTELGKKMYSIFTGVGTTVGAGSIRVVYFVCYVRYSTIVDTEPHRRGA